ncbi:MAG TPA: FAD-binding protein, partial [Candidatus Thermoplasmatota archaeon]
MFDDIPEPYRAQTADDEEEGWRYTQGDKTARRPPELLTRDHVSRCIVREIKEGRGSPHGGVFLDISWIKEKIPGAAEHIKRKLPSMYHQFKQLADIDITKEPMEVGPTTHYIMGGVRVDAETQMSTVPGLFAAGECAAGINGANRLGGNSLSDLLVFGQRAGQFAAAFAREHAPGRPGSVDERQVERAVRDALRPFERGPRTGEDTNPYAIQSDLQEMMQNLVGIVRTEDEMQRALDGLEALRARADRTGVGGNREYNPGWHTALDLGNLLTVAEAVTRAAIERRESRGAHFREDYPDKSPALGAVNIVLRKRADGSMQVERAPIPEMPAELKRIVEENR